MLKEIEAGWEDFWAYHWRVDHLHSIPGIFEWNEKLVDFILHVLELKEKSRILDIGCGGGDHALVLAKRGFLTAGIDIASSLIAFARSRFQQEGLSGDFFVGDMRKLNFNEEFDACLILSSSFGFFTDKENKNILQGIYKTLKPGGKAFVMYKSAHYPEKHERRWYPIKDGWQLSESWFDAEDCCYKSTCFIIKKDGTLIKPRVEKGYHAHEKIRCYTLPEIRSLLSWAGLEYLNSYSEKELSIPVRPLPLHTPRNIFTAVKPR